MADLINEYLLREPQKAFEDHLFIPSNYRIIFSGRFGIGKSTFINHFFQTTSKYNCIHLYPVNYSIATNEDIFKYIKYDIILEMMIKKYPVDSLDFSRWHSIPAFLSKNFKKLAATLLYAIPAVGKDMVDLADRVITFAEEFNEQHKKNTTQGDEQKALEDYMSSIETFDGSIYESGLETRIIENILQKKKEEDDQKENVLIIDDLDRIDPEHIFRILNIFAAHFDHRDGTANKFGFDKVILVCDIENIRSIFHHKYGGNVDFNGYIDKFYSHEVFEYSNQKSLNNFVRESLLNIKWISSDFLPIQVHDIKRELLKGNNFLVGFIGELCRLGMLNLRNLVKWQSNPFYFEEFVVVENRELSVDDNHPILIMKFLSTFFGGTSSLASTMKKILISRLRLERRVIENFCFQLISIFTEQEGDGLNVDMPFAFDEISYSAKYEKIGGLSH